ncbi:MAG: gliding motility-associated C-terminal domain-containing protein [Cyclobacteriaceae bacterium]|nr:gliding motility-associated C-terminal domain-containing protein [Cyclobacteriaceae bacterium]
MKCLVFIGFTLFSMGLNIVHASDGYRFIPNQGQWHPDALFRAQIPAGQLYLCKDALKFVLYDKARLSHKHSEEYKQFMGVAKMSNNDMLDLHAVFMRFVGANEHPAVQSAGSFPEEYNFFLGSAQDKWVSGLKASAEVQLSQIYPGIDFKMYGSGPDLKYDFLVHPGEDASSILIEYEGADNVRIIDGQLQIETSLGHLVEGEPFAYQLIGGKQVEVKCHFVTNKNQVRFEFPEGYNKDYTLVIDPLLIFSSFSGSSADNWGFTATPADNGDLYSGGIVSDIGFPVTSGAYQRNFGGLWDVGILKFDSAGSRLLFASYLGGLESEVPQSLVEDQEGNLIILGSTSSDNFPVTDGVLQAGFAGGTPMPGNASPVEGVPYNNGSDLFIAKLSSNGRQLLASTYLGGSDNDGILPAGRPLTKNYGDQFRSDVTFDKDNNILIASHSASADFPVSNGFQMSFGGGTHDGIVCKISSDLKQIEWASYVGGAGMDALFSIKTDDEGTVYAAGGTNSTNLPVSVKAIKNQKPLPSDIDGMIVKISRDGSALLSATYLGTEAYDQIYFLDLDDKNQVYVLGQTNGDYPISEGVYSVNRGGQFIHCLNNELSASIFSTVFGKNTGGPDISPTAFMVNECGNLFVSGWGGIINQRLPSYIGGNTSGLPVTEDAFQKTSDGNDFYLMVLLEGARQLLYATYFGGNQSREHVDGGTSRFDKRGIVYQAVCGGCGGFSDFPTTPGAWSNRNNSNNCNNAVFKFDMASLKAAFTTDNAQFTRPGLEQGCFPLEVMFLNRSQGGREFFWDFGEGTTSQKRDSILITYHNPGVYDVSLKAVDLNTCIREDIATGKITVLEGFFNVTDDKAICYGDDVQLEASGGNFYQWNPDSTLNSTSIPNPLASPKVSQSYTVYIRDVNECEYFDTVYVKVVPPIFVSLDFDAEPNCLAPPRFYFKSTQQGAESILWEFSDGRQSEEDSLYHVFDADGMFEVTLKGFSDFCVVEEKTNVLSINTFIPNVITPNDDGKNDTFVITSLKKPELSVFNRWGKLVYFSETYDNNWSAQGLTGGVYYYEARLDDENTCKGWLHVIHE